MAVNLGAQDDDEVISQINTTPLVDVMLVLLIIFLITIPVVTASVPVALPRESMQPRDSNPAIATIAIDAQGRLYWHDSPVQSLAELQQRLQTTLARAPQTEVQIRGDVQSEFAAVQQVLDLLKALGVQKIGFVTEPA